MLLEDAVKRTMIELDATMLRDMTDRRDHQGKIRSLASSRIKHEDLYDEFDSGTTAIVVILTPRYIICANLVSFLLLYARALLDR